LMMWWLWLWWWWWGWVGVERWLMWWLVEGRESVVVVVTRWRVLFFISAVVVMSVSYFWRVMAMVEGELHFCDDWIFDLIII
jgi:hypothetical protein